MIARLLSLPSFLIGLVIYGLVSLGFWQLERADEKQRIIDNRTLAQSLAPEQISNSSDLLKKEYHKVLLAGNYVDDSQFIYDNQTVNGNAGYYVLTPFVLSDHKAILINRGFVSWNGRRDSIGSINIGAQNRVIEVSLIKPVERMNLNEDLISNVFPVLIQSVNIGKISALSNLDLVPIIGRLDKASEDGFYRKWQPFYGSIDKHLGYAFQWFTMAFALFVISLKLLIRSK
ncbi:SURF1 family protein [Candidatus Thioglobus sp.]|uniref:SURF1 family protein n=1 Tax=Candidatus Thioglobus sp. TaxID=2026721 RepID=UPI00262A0F7D|nr:SURF1 family protein [Candidatus Thioglobus sp.]MDG2394972.1 SURF1 family protein [Candidatus Thioglobus sp.]